MKENNRTVNITVRFTPEEKDKLVDMCANKNTTVSQMIRELVEKEMERNSKLFGF